MSQRRQTQVTSVLAAQSRPIYIEDETSPKHAKYLNTVATISRLPAFDPDDHITKLLYSKFIVKGVKPINQDAIIEKLKKTSRPQHFQKTTRQTTHCTKDAFVREASTRRDPKQHSRQLSEKGDVFDFSMERFINRQQSLGNLNKTRRPSSGFQRSNNKNILGRPQSASLKLLNRPQSAYTARTASHNQAQDAHRDLASERPQSSFERTPSKKKPEYYQYGQHLVPNILTISQGSPRIKKVDFIQKNKRQASSRKKSIYLTTSEVPNDSLIKSAVHRAKVQKPHVQQEVKLKRQTLTKQQKQAITSRQREYLQYMKENMPMQYQECVEYLLSLEEQGEQAKSIFSCSLGEEEPISMTSKQIEEFQVQEFYKDFLNKCLNMEHHINQAKTKKRHDPQTVSSILNCDQTQQLLELYQQLQRLKQSSLNYDHLSERIRRIVKDLSFFRENRAQVVGSIFKMDYEILEVEQNQVVIENNSAVKFVYVILNGSVTRQNARQDNDSLLRDELEPPQYLNTLFDGEIFGLPAKNYDRYLHYTIKTIEKCLLMLLPYQSFRQALSHNQNIHDRIELLESMFPSQGRLKLTKEDYEAIAYQMETVSFPSQTVIVREGQKRDQLMVVASGNVSVCFESVMRRKKQNVDPLAKDRKQIIKPIDISGLRRSNLVNYELLFQNQREKHYYLAQVVEEKIRGDVLNWRGFGDSLLSQEDSQVNTPPFQHSLMSAHNSTTLYLISPSKVAGLSKHIQKCIVESTERHQSQAVIRRDQGTIDKWQQFKIKVCKQILAKKTKQ